MLPFFLRVVAFWIMSLNWSCRINYNVWRPGLFLDSIVICRRQLVYWINITEIVKKKLCLEGVCCVVQCNNAALSCKTPVTDLFKLLRFCNVPWYYCLDDIHVYTHDMIQPILLFDVLHGKAVNSKVDAWQKKMYKKKKLNIFWRVSFPSYSVESCNHFVLNKYSLRNKGAICHFFTSNTQHTSV